MPFGVWFYICKLSFWPLVGSVGVGLCLHNALGRCLLVAGAAGALTLGLAGAWLGVLMTRGGLQMRCPYCRSKGDAWGSPAEGLRMQCPRCGLIRSRGLLGLRLAREHVPANEPIIAPRGGQR